MNKIPIIFLAGLSIGLTFLDFKNRSTIQALNHKIASLESNSSRVSDREDLWSSIAIGAVKTHGKLSKNEYGYNQRTLRVKVMPSSTINEYGGTLDSDSSFGITKVSKDEYEIYISGRIK